MFKVIIEEGRELSQEETKLLQGYKPLEMIKVRVGDRDTADSVVENVFASPEVDVIVLADWQYLVKRLAFITGALRGVGAEWPRIFVVENGEII